MLIAEIGNNHQGSLERAVLMLHLASESGADVVKFQAIRANELDGGSMQKGFYEKCELSLNDYIKLASICKKHDIKSMISIFSDELLFLKDHFDYYKIAGAQSLKGDIDLTKHDDRKTFISLKKESYKNYRLKHAQLFYVSDYLAENPELEYIDEYNKHFNYNDKRIGYSDHTLGIDWPIIAIEKHRVRTIEKHFILDEDQNNIYYNNKLFRDSVHSANPKEFKQLKKELRRGR